MNRPDLSTIEKTLDNEATAAEAREVARWFRTPEGQAWLAERMDRDEQAIRPGEEEAWAGGPIPSTRMYEQIRRRLRWQRIRRRITYAAAVLLPVALLLGLFLHLNARVDLLADGAYDEVTVPAGERMQLLFQDGSKVHLNAGSRIRYPRKFSLTERKVYLEGEAWFEVAKNRHRPFIVDLDCMQVAVLGTTFDVKAYPEEREIFVSLESGAVELHAATFSPHRLRPGERAVYDRASGQCRVVRPADIRRASAWRNHMLVFNKTPLAEVLRTLARAYDANFTVKDSAALAYSYTITTDTTRLDAILRELEKITPVRFEARGGTIEVHMKR